MRLGSLTLSATLSAALLSGCSFIGGQPSNHGNTYAQQNAGHQGQYGQQQYGQQQYGQQASGQRCQIASSRQPIPRGCRPEQVTIGTSAQNSYNGQQPNYGAQGGFSQQPQFGQPQYTDGGYGNAVGQTASVAHHTSGPKKRKPKLRGSLSLGVEKSNSGNLIDYVKLDGGGPDPLSGYDPQAFIAGGTGPGPNGGTQTAVYTANEQFAADIYNPFTYESGSRPAVSFDDAWSTPATVKAGLEYVISKNTTVFANGGYSFAAGNDGTTADVTATLYKDFIEVDDTGIILAQGIQYIPNVEIATFNYDFSDLERYEVEVGARHYLKPLVKSEGFRTVTPFVGASVGLAHVNAVDLSVGQRQIAYDTTFENLSTGENDGATDWFDVAPGGPGANSSLGTKTRLYDSQWLPQAQLNVGAEWQITPGLALAAETGVSIQDSRDYAGFTNGAGDFVEGRKGDANISIPLTLRGSINF